MATKRSAADYAAMAEEFEAEPPRASGPISEGLGATVRLKNGRPSGRRVAAGNTPTTSVRLPQDIRDQLDEQAAAEAIKPSEIVRRAVVEYLDRHGR